MEDSDPEALLLAIIERLNEKGVAFLEMNEGLHIAGCTENNIESLKDNLFCKKFKPLFKGSWISNHGYTLNTANEHL